MARRFNLKVPKTLPRWSVVPVGLALAAFAVALGLVLEPAGYALSPSKEVPTPTIPAVAYGRSISESCQTCHFSLDLLEASAQDPATANAYLIQPHTMQTPHGSLGCVACHHGKGDQSEKDAAHEGLVADISETHPEQCIICHQDLPTQTEENALRIPHELISNWIAHGEPGTLFCSDCHGGVGHGFDPVSGETTCPMDVCIDCHAKQDECSQCHQSGDLTGEPTGEMVGCEVCHDGPHDVVTYMVCSCCHTSVTDWAEIHPDSHPIELVGRHAETHCFECHTFPNFNGLRYICTDCHESGHDWGDDDCTECHDPGATWDLVASTWDKHADFWDMYKGDHLLVACSGCHFETYTGLDPNCDTCHLLPESHEASYTECWLCH